MHFAFHWNIRNKLDFWNFLIPRIWICTRTMMKIYVYSYFHFRCVMLLLIQHDVWFRILTEIRKGRDNLGFTVTEQDLISVTHILENTAIPYNLCLGNVIYIVLLTACQIWQITKFLCNVWLYVHILTLIDNFLDEPILGWLCLYIYATSQIIQVVDWPTQLSIGVML